MKQTMNGPMKREKIKSGGPGWVTIGTGVLAVLLFAAGLYKYFSASRNAPAAETVRVSIAAQPQRKPSKGESKRSQQARLERLRTSMDQKPTMQLTEDEEAMLTPEMRQILSELQDALDNDDAQAVSKLAERILVKQRKLGQDSVPPYVREKAVEAIGFFLPGSLADLVGFMADSDPDVLQDVMDKFSEAIDDPDLGDRELSAILSSVAEALNNEDAVDSLFLAIESDMRNSVAVETYLNVWKTGSDEVKAKIEESISDFTGEDGINTPEQLKQWLAENPDDPDDDDFYKGGSDDTDE